MRDILSPLSPLPMVLFFSYWAFRGVLLWLWVPLAALMGLTTVVLFYGRLKGVDEQIQRERDTMPEPTAEQRAADLQKHAMRTRVAGCFDAFLLVMWCYSWASLYQ